MKEQENQFKNFEVKKTNNFMEKNEKKKKEIKKVKNAFEKEQLEQNASHEKTLKELEKRLNEDIKKFKSVYDQTTKALECKIIKESEAIKKETKIISHKLEKTEKTTLEVREYVDKVQIMKDVPRKRLKPPKINQSQRNILKRTRKIKLSQSLKQRRIVD